MRLLTAAVVSLSALALTPASALAAPPPNDNYLASLPIQPQAENTLQADTTEAGTQTDLFNPNRDGQPLGGGDPETTVCNGVSFGKTVWYDFAPPVNYGVSLRATGLNTVVAVYEWNPQTSRITRLMGCSANASTEDLLLDLEGEKNYTIQVGGVAGAGGPLTLRMEGYPDADGDGQFDVLDECPEVPGIKAAGYCPPSLRGRVSPSVSWAPGSGGVRITRLTVDSVPKGAKVTARCAGCGSQTITAKRQGRVSLSRLVGRTARSGGNIEVKITMRRTGKGRYRFGATGISFKWPVRADGLGKRKLSCLNVRTGKTERCR
jgi:hypothetical protein